MPAIRHFLSDGLTMVRSSRQHALSRASMIPGEKAGRAMAQRAEISCISKAERFNPHERITHVGGVHNGTRWRLTHAQAIQHIETGQTSFYVSRNGQAVNVIVAKSRFGNKYLKTTSDGEEPNNLLSLSSCPV